MSYKVHDKELASLLKTSAPARYEYFVNKIADFKEIWSVGDDNGWAMMNDNDKTPLVPVWPAERFAEICCVGEWRGFRPRVISLNIWLSRWIMGMIKDGKKVAAFVVPGDLGIVVTPEKLQTDIRMALDCLEE